VVISAIPNNVFEALHAGAIDFVSKPNTSPGFDNAAFLKEAASKIRIASNSVSRPSTTAGASISTNSAASAATAAAASARVMTARPTSQPAATARQAAAPSSPAISRLVHSNPKTVIAIGASTGGTEAILEVIQRLPENSPGIVVVQHMPPVFTKMYAERLDKICKMNVREAEDGDRVETGVALIAAGDRQMRLIRDARGYFVRCGGTDKVSGHCPSVDVLFESVAQAAGTNALGVILTGMGSDGAKGLLEMKKSGAHTIGQNQETCVVYGMPMVAFNIGAVKEQLPLGSITDGLMRRLTGR